jgi:Family of unknown function (DUF6519)/IPT/TIG domain
MAGDRARVSYDPSRKWRGLVAQQGRVTLDADWNEAAAIGEERDRLAARDAVGPVGTPDGGYSVTAVPAAAPGPAMPGDLTIGPGTLYLGGERLDLDAPVTYSTQPDWLDHSTDPLWVPPAVPAGTSFELVYLLAAEQEVSATEDPALADVALGGPDTMQRQQILQRFVRQPSPSGTCADAWSAFVSSLGGKGLQFDAASMTIGSATTLQVSFANAPAVPNQCEPVATGGFQGAENQMIRVMVASVDAAGVPTIAWGFDDASFLYRLKAATYDSAGDQTTVTLASAPVDNFHNPGAGQAVELLRDAVRLTATDYIAAPAGVVMPLFSAYDPTQMQLVISGQPPDDYLSAATPQLYLRVWQSTVAAQPGAATALGDTGIAVTLTSSTGTFHAGDFWCFALRPIEPAIVYPARYLAAPQPPDGPRTLTCPLAVLTWEEGNVTPSNCVPLFDDLVKLTAFRSCCCTVDVQTSDVDGGATLQALLGKYANRGPVTVCLEPGIYTLPAPLMLGPELDGITLQGCREGVILQAPSQPGDEFVGGLIALQGVTGATIRGVQLSVPLAKFSPPDGSFASLPTANQQLLTSFSSGLQLAIGIVVADSASVAVADCTFVFPDPGGANALGAGILGKGTVDGIGVTGCTFQAASPPDAVPFYDLAAGNLVLAPYQLTIGYLQVPALETPDATGAKLPLLQDATIERCLYQGVTVPALVMAELGLLRVARNTVRNCYGGFWLVSIPSPASLSWFNALAIGSPNTYLFLARIGLAAAADRIFVIASALVQVLPATPGGGHLVAGKMPLPDEIELAMARQTFRAILARATQPAGMAGATAADVAPAAARRAQAAEPGAGEPEPAGPGAAGAGDIGMVEVDLPPAIVTLLAPLAAAAPMGAPPAADTGTGVSLRLDVRECQIDAVIEDSYSGAGLLVIDFTQDTGSATVQGNRIRTRFPWGEAALAMQLSEATVTGNVIANEVAPPAEPTNTDPNSFSMTYFAATPLGAPAVAITGNVFIDPTVVPARPDTIPAPVTDWNVLNTVIAYVGPPTITGISPPRGTPAGGDSVTITGTDFTQVTVVQFGGVNSPSVSVGSNTQITAASPPGSGTVDVTVTTRAGISEPTVADHFTYGPSITGLSPQSGNAFGGDDVTVIGSGFTGATAVQFGGRLAAALNVVSDTQINVITPPGLGLVFVTVTTPAGTSPATTSGSFRYFPMIQERPAASPQEQPPAARRRRSPASPQEQPPAARRRRSPASPQEQPPAAEPPAAKPPAAPRRRKKPS